MVLLALASCASVPTSRDLLGMWASSPGSGAGASTATFCFSQDGSVEWISQSQGRTTRVHGTYTIAGDTLTIESSDLDEPAKLKASLSLGKLSLTTSNGSTQKLSRVPGRCDDNGR